MAPVVRAPGGVTSPALPSAGSARSGAGAPVEFVGRDRERRRLAELVGGLDAGRGGLLLIGGEAGIGKTALGMGSARAAAARGALVLVGACDALAPTSPYGPWFAIVQACHDQCPELPPLSGRLAAEPAGFAAFDGQDALVDGVRQLLGEVAARRPAL